MSHITPDIHTKPLHSYDHIGPDLMSRAATLMTVAPETEVTQVTGFYDKGSVSEAERLRMMAMIADGVSCEMVTRLQEQLNVTSPRVIDIGAGDSTTLGCDLVRKGFIYTPVDIREDALTAHRSVGFEGVHSTATQLAIESASVDVAHARFTWGWLSNVERMQSLAEMLRTGRNDMALTIIDYDWSQADGPTIFMNMVEDVKRIMRQTGFNPEYGGELAADLQEKLSHLVDGPHSLTVSHTPTYEGVIGGAMPMVAQTARAIAEQLRALGMTTQADRLLANLETLYQYAVKHDDVQVSLPTIMAVGTTILDAPSRFSGAMTTYLNATEQTETSRSMETMQEGVDFRRALPDIPSVQHVAIATSHEMILEARRIQTTAYYKDEIIGFDAVNERGVLVDGNDPIDLVRRSQYYVPLGEANWMAGVVRTITPDPTRGFASLPTFHRIAHHSPLTATRLKDCDWAKDPNNIVEVSGLAKNMLGGKLEDVMLAMLVLCETTVREGRRYGVMALQESKVGLIESLFGTRAIRRIEGEDAVHPIDLPGVRDAVRFVPLYVDGEEFIEEVYAHARQRKSPLFRTLEVAARDILDSRA